MFLESEGERYSLLDQGFPGQVHKMDTSYDENKRTADRRAVGDQVVNERRGGELFILILFAFKLTAEVP